MKTGRSKPVSSASRSSEGDEERKDKEVRRASRGAPRGSEPDASQVTQPKGDEEGRPDHLELQRTMMLNGTEELCLRKQHACA